MLIEKMCNIRDMLENVETHGSVNMLTLVTAIANINEIIKELRGERDEAD